MQSGCDDGLLALAGEVMRRVASVLAGETKAYDGDLHKWCAEVFAGLDRAKCEDTGLTEGIEACLVDVLSCDDASWDTPRWALRADMEALGNLIAARTQGSGPGILGNGINE